MKGLSFVLVLAFVVGFGLLGCGESAEPLLAPNDQSVAKSSLAGSALEKKPAPTLIGTTTYTFVGTLGIFDAEGRLLAWQGTVSGDIVGVIQWWMVGESMSYTGQASHYVDRFEILNAAGELLLAGDEAGTTTARLGKNSNWRTNGTITETGPGFEDWLGRMEHAEGHFTWAAPGLPEEGYGTIRIH
jgi:hypothetical protein